MVKNAPLGHRELILLVQIICMQPGVTLRNPCLSQKLFLVHASISLHLGHKRH